MIGCADSPRYRKCDLRGAGQKKSLSNEESKSLLLHTQYDGGLPAALGLDLRGIFCAQYGAAW